VLKKEPETRKPNKWDDLLGLLGGLLCLGFAQFDAAWAGFWTIAGMVLIAWSAVSYLRRRSRG
jgi:hypothetical protein